MEYQLSILAGFRDKLIESTYLKLEIQKSLMFIKYVTLLSSIANLLFGVMDIIFLTWTKEVLFLDFAVRIANVIIAVCLFVFLNEIKNHKFTGIYFCCFAVVLYGSHLFVASHFVPVDILFESFSVVLITPCIFLVPNKWIINCIFALIILGMYIIAMPYLCIEAVRGDRIITIAFLIWNLAIISILFYRISIHKRNHFANELQLKELAKTDYLTKIRNRKACDEILEAECVKKTEFSFVMFDIDNFKDINDTCGHSVGDAVIVSITTVVKQIIRKNDILARWGGEEFAVIMPQTTLKEAVESAERIRKRISLIENNRVKSPITCSFGVTTFNNGDTVESITRRVDQLLYLAKEYGRNRVVAG